MISRAAGRRQQHGQDRDFPMSGPPYPPYGLDLRCPAIYRRFRRPHAIEEQRMSLDDRLRADARELAPELVLLRRALHEHPEIGLDLPFTQRMVLDAIDGLGLEVTSGSGSSSVTAVLRGGGGRPGP